MTARGDAPPGLVVTPRKPDEELRGLVYGLTPKRRRAVERWWK